MAKSNITIPEFRNKEEFGLFLLSAAVKQAIEEKVSYSFSDMGLFAGYVSLRNSIGVGEFAEFEKRFKFVPVSFKSNEAKIAGSVIVFNVLLDDEYIFNIDMKVKEKSGSLLDKDSEFLDFIFKRFKGYKTADEKMEYIKFQLGRNVSDAKIRIDFLTKYIHANDDEEYVKEFSSKVLELYNACKLDNLKLKEEKKMSVKEKVKEKLEKKIAEKLENNDYNVCKDLGLDKDQAEFANKVLTDGIGMVLGGIAKVNGKVSIKGKIGIRINADISVDFENVKSSEDKKEPIAEKVKGNFILKDTGLEAEVDLVIDASAGGDLKADASLNK